MDVSEQTKNGWEGKILKKLTKPGSFANFLCDNIFANSCVSDLSTQFSALI